MTFFSAFIQIRRNTERVNFFGSQPLVKAGAKAAHEKMEQSLTYYPNLFQLKGYGPS